MNLFRAGLAAGLMALVSAAPALGQTIESYVGPVDVPETPETIAVFDIAAIDTIDALGVGIEGVPDNLFLDVLKERLGSVPTVGTLFEPDLEALNELQPDLIIVGGRSSTQLDQVIRVAPAIDMTLWGDTMLDDARQRIADYGSIFDKEAEAESLLADFDSSIARAKDAAAGKGTALILMTNGPKISAYGPGSRFAWLYKALDIEAAADNPDAGTHGDAVSFEFVAGTNPDWLIILDRAAAIGSGEQNARTTLDNELVHSTTAWTKNQIIYLPSDDVYIASGGARATVRVFDALTAGFSSAE